MQIDILTLFPDMFLAPLGQSIIGRAVDRGILNIQTHQIRDFTTNRQNQVDDYPYGGGAGVVMNAQPLYDAWKHIKEKQPGAHTIYFSPRGKVFSQADARRFAEEYSSLIFVCGHYEGVDERFIQTAVDEEISLGDFVLTGGEIPAMAVCDAVCRLVPGVLSGPECFIEESHWSGLLEHPHYTRPEVWQGLEVPEVLRGGVHKDIAAWRRKKAFEATISNRPDLFAAYLPTKADLALLGQLREESGHPAVQGTLKHLHTQRITVRRGTPADAKRIAPEDPDYLSRRRERGIIDYAVYAEGLGFCGHISYEICGETAKLQFDLRPHAQGRGIDSFALAAVVDDIFAQTRANACVLPLHVCAEAAKRLGAEENASISRADWTKKRNIE